MKLKGARLEAFLKDPEDGVVVALVYGPDRGLVAERARGIAVAIVEDPGDPFRVAELSEAGLKADPSRLGDEAATMPLGGERRLIRVRDAADTITDAVRPILESPPDRGFVLLESGDLGPRSSLRRLLEDAGGGGAAIPCYADDAEALGRLIRDTLRDAKLSVEPPALAFLTQWLGADRRLTRNELEKLVLYKEGQGTVTLEDAMAALGDSRAASLEAIALAVADGDQAELDRVLEAATLEGAQPVGVLRAVGRHFVRLQLLQGLVSRGQTPADAIAALRPPIFFMHRRRVLAQLTRWSALRLERTLDLLLTAERQCKTTGMPDHALTGRALMSVTRAAQTAAARR